MQIEIMLIAPLSDAFLPFEMHGLSLFSFHFSFCLLQIHPILELILH